MNPSEFRIPRGKLTDAVIPQLRQLESIPGWDVETIGAGIGGMAVDCAAVAVFSYPIDDDADALLTVRVYASPGWALVAKLTEHNRQTVRGIYVGIDTRLATSAAVVLRGIVRSALTGSVADAADMIDRCGMNRLDSGLASAVVLSRGSAR